MFYQQSKWQDFFVREFKDFQCLEYIQETDQKYCNMATFFSNFFVSLLLSYPATGGFISTEVGPGFLTNAEKAQNIKFIFVFSHGSKACFFPGSNSSILQNFKVPFTLWILHT